MQPEPKPMPTPMPPKPMPPKPVKPTPVKPTPPMPPKPMPPMPLKPTYPAPPKPMPMPPTTIPGSGFTPEQKYMADQAAAAALLGKIKTVNPGPMAPDKPNYGIAYEPKASNMPVPVNPNPPQYMKKGGKVKSSSASSRGDGIAQRGKTKGRFV